MFSSDGSSEFDGFGVDDVRVDNQLADLALTAIDATPAVTCAGVSTPIRATVRNDGITTIGAFPISYTVDGGAPVTQTVTRTLRPGETYDFTFTAPAVLAAGARTIAVTIALAGDAIAANNTRSATVMIEPVTAVMAAAPYAEGFETGAGGWTTSGTMSSWVRGTPPVRPFIPAAGAGTSAWVQSNVPDRTYNNSELSYLLSPCFDFSAVTTVPTVSFLHIYKTRATDRGWFEITRDGLTWTKLGISGDGTNWYSDATNDVWSGNSGMPGVWRTASRTAEGVAGLPLVRFRFVFSSDLSGTDEGFGVDAFTITP